MQHMQRLSQSRLRTSDPAPVPLCPPQTSLDQTRVWTLAAAVGSQRLTASAMARPISKSWFRAPSGAHDQIIITFWQLRSCFSGTTSLTRWRVCLLYMLLALASVVFLGLSQIWDFLSSPPTTRRVTVELFEPASTRVSPLFKIKVTLRPTVSRPICLVSNTHLGLRVNLECRTKSKSKLPCDWRWSNSKSWCRAPSGDHD
jgi:hypothetical protein